jgi:hypothetical protein
MVVMSTGVAEEHVAPATPYNEEAMIDALEGLVSPETGEEPPTTQKSERVVETDSVEENNVEVLEDQSDEDLEDLSVESDEEEPEDEGTESLEDDEIFEIFGEEVPTSQILEWRDNGLRQSDYTKKTTALAREREADTAQREADKVEREALVAERAELQQLLTDYRTKTVEVGLESFKNIDWEELKSNDPEEHQRQRLEYMIASQEAEKLQRAEAHLQAQNQAEYEKHKQAAIANTQKVLLDKHPELFGDNKAELWESMGKYAESQGITPEQMENTIEPGPLSLLYKAMLYDQLDSGVTTKPKRKVTKSVRRIKGGTPVTRGERKAKAAKKILDKQRATGSVEDTAEALLQLGALD